MKSLLALFLCLLPLPAFAQIGPVGAISIGQTSVTGGTNGDCLIVSSGKVGQQVCGSGPVNPDSIVIGSATGGSEGTGTLNAASFLYQNGRAMVVDIPSFTSNFFGIGTVPALSSSSSGGATDCTGIFGQRNFAAGPSAGVALTNGCSNTAVGYHALNANQSNVGNTAGGAFTMAVLNASGADANTGWGYSVMSSMTNGTFNAGFGNSVFQNAVTGVSFNSGFGAHTFLSLTTGTENSGFGNSAFTAMTSGSNNTGAGSSAGAALTSGSGLTLYGRQALRQATSLSNATIIGTNAGDAHTSGNTVTMVGYQAAFHDATGTAFVAMGDSALFNNTVANDNTAVGEAAGFGNGGTYSATGNTLFGKRAGFNLTGSGVANNNAFFGAFAGHGATTGSQNTILGVANSSAGLAQVTTGSQNISIGYDNAVASATASGQLVIGNFIYGTGLTGTGATISTAKIGLGVKAPAVELDVVGTINASTAIVSTAGTIQYLGSGGGTADAITLTPSPALTAYATGACYTYKSTAANATTTPTIAISGLAAKTVVKRAATALAAGDITNGGIESICYDGTNLQLLNPVVN